MVLESRMRWSLENSQRPNIPLIDNRRIAVNPEGGDGKIPKGIGEEI